MKAILLQEPELEFGTGRHVDIRFGLMAHGPVDFEDSPASRIRAGIVGPPNLSNPNRHVLKVDIAPRHETTFSIAEPRH